MKSIKIAGKKIKLGSRLARLYALFIDLTSLTVVQIIALFLMRLIGHIISPSMWNHPETGWQSFILGIFVFSSIAL